MSSPDKSAAKPLVLITGACGFLGQSLVSEFQAAGFAVRAFDVVPPPAGCTPDEFQVGDVADIASVAKACAGVAALVISHMAPQRPGVYDTPTLPFDINVKGTALLCAEAAKQGIKRVVLISSIAVVDGHRASGQRFVRSLPPLPVGLYGLTKHLQEQIIDFHQRLGHFTAVSLRPAYVTDADTLTDKYQRQRPSVNWQFIDRRDIAGAAIAALTTGRDAQGAYFIHGHRDAPKHLETDPTARDLGWTPRFDFSNWPDDAPVAT
jgi:nucleoside-diphosphate-sugar epimerase